PVYTLALHDALPILFGQSNMEGVPDPEAEDLVENERVQVLGYDSGCLGRQWNEWAVAKPPLHRCWTGVGPGDSFGKAMAEAWPEDRKSTRLNSSHVK